MLTIIIPGGRLWDNRSEKFINIKPTELILEHSLLSLSKWEARWKKPFLNLNKENAMSGTEIIDYIRCMTINDNVDDSVYYALTEQNIKNILDYIEDPMTATVISNKDKAGRRDRKILTNEVIYYYMTELNIPFTCETWHLNRLLTLIQVASIEKQPPKKMGRREQLAQQRALNEARKAKHHTRG